MEPLGSTMVSKQSCTSTSAELRKRKIPLEDKAGDESPADTATKFKPKGEGQYSCVKGCCKKCCFSICTMFASIVALVVYWMTPLIVRASLLDTEHNLRERSDLHDELKERANSTATKQVFLKARRIKQWLNVWRVNNFLSDGEVEYLMRAYKPHLYRCPFSIHIPFTDIWIGGRACEEYQGTMKKEYHELLDKIEQRMVSFITSFAEVKEISKRDYMDWQIVRYAPNQGFTAHYDESENDNGNRIPMPMTFMVFLSNMAYGAGGSTEFLTDGEDVEVNDPAKIVSVKPRKGDLLLWTTCTRKGELDPQAYHRGEYLKVGEKWILNRFFRHPADINIKKCREGLKPLEVVKATYLL